jgi:hypothetical protein
MIRVTATALALLLTAAAAPAQSIGEPLPGRGPAKQRVKPVPADVGGTRPCPEYGPGFVRVEGSTSCVRVGGSVRVEMGKSSRSGFGTSTGALVQLEGRGESTLGPVRGVLRMRGQLDRGLDSGSYNYR